MARPVASIDFETYSEAGYFFERKRWRSIAGDKKKGGLQVVGAAVYAEHPSTEVLSLAYDLGTGAGVQVWTPQDPPPVALFDHIRSCGLVDAYNDLFEFYIWRAVCAARMGWPELPLAQLRDTMARAAAFNLPRSLEGAAKVARAPIQKLADGERLIKKFSTPRSPTLRDSRLRLLPAADLVDGPALLAYNAQDVLAEQSLAAMIPELSKFEQRVSLLDHEINVRGVAVDTESVAACMAIVDEAHGTYTAELVRLTGGAVGSVNEIAKISGWLASRHWPVHSLDAEAIEDTLKEPMLPPDVRRVLQIRATLSAASVKKLYSLARTVARDGRVHDLFAFCGANTGRWTGRGSQPQNFPSGGPSLLECEACGTQYGDALAQCPVCADLIGSKRVEWSIRGIERVLGQIRAGATLADLEREYGDALAAVSGCLRGLFVAGEGCELIASDYSAIEAVVLAALSGEQWRLDVFAGHGKIYETSASRITGVPLEEYLEYRKRTGEHHPDRKKGKVAELASGYQGGWMAWYKFGADKFMSEHEVKSAVKAWRAASPMIVQFWYAVEDAARKAMQIPGQAFGYRDIAYKVAGDVLYCRLPSGRCIAYHNPRIVRRNRSEPGEDAWWVDEITFMGVDPKTKQWVRISTYGGKLTENIVQATSRELLAHALLGLNAAGYPAVLHVHDEIVAEIPTGYGSVEEFERIMARVPTWAAGWPVRAAGGWRGHRYRK